MKQLILILTILPFFTFCGQQKEKTDKLDKTSETQTSETNNDTSTPKFHATYYLIRHAEKVRENPKDQDPKLDAKGMMRAKTWAAYFEPILIDEIYTTDFLRTKQTIALIAEQKMVSPKIYDQNTIYSEEFLKETNGKNVLIVGHSNTIPYLVNKLINENKFTDMDDNENSTLFKVTIDGDNKKVDTISVD